MFSEITTIIFSLSTILEKIFYIINDEEYNNIKKMFGWTKTNGVLFIIFFILLLLSIERCIKVVKFFCWLSALIICLLCMYLLL